MVIESNGKEQCYDEQSRENQLITRTNHRQPDEAHNEYHKLGCHDVCQDGANKESFFALEE
jgi:hypothetical protein